MYRNIHELKLLQPITSDVIGCTACTRFLTVRHACTDLDSVTRAGGGIGPRHPPEPVIFCSLMIAHSRKSNSAGDSCHQKRQTFFKFAARRELPCRSAHVNITSIRPTQAKLPVAAAN